MAFDLVLPEVFPCAKFFAALFTRILHAPLALFFRGSTIRNIVADEPLCNPYQTTVVAGSFYMDICVITSRGLGADRRPSSFLHGQRYTAK
jgi:hypothetical protein